MVYKKYSFALAMIIAGASFGQDITINYNADGSALLNSYSPKGNSFWVLDNSKLTHEEFLFPDGRRRMWSSYRYDDEHIIEEQHFIYTQGREKTVKSFDHFGNEVDVEYFKHISGNDWKSQHRMTSTYDSYNNRTHFTSVGYSGGEYMNSETFYTYDYPNYKRHMHDIDKDKNGRIIYNHKGTNAYPQSVIDREAERGKLENQYNRIYKSSTKAANGNLINIVRTEESKSIQTFNSKGQLIDHQLFNAGGSDGMVINYDPYYRFKFKYDKSGRVEQVNAIYEVKGYKEWKTVYQYNSSGKLIKESSYVQAGGKWKFLATEHHKGLEPMYTPNPSTRPSAVAPLTKPYTHGEPKSSGAVHSTPPPSSGSSSSDGSSNLIDQLSPGGHEDGSQVSIYDSDMQKLQQLVRVMNVKSTNEITEADILKAALEMLIKEHRAEIKEANESFLADQSTLFD